MKSADILRHLLQRRDYRERIMPHLTEESFTNENYVLIFRIIKEFLDSYGEIIDVESLENKIEDITGITQDQFNDIVGIVQHLKDPINEERNLKYLIDETEKEIQRGKITTTIQKIIPYVDDPQEVRKNYDNIVKELKDAVFTTFDYEIGQDFKADWEKRWDFYRRKEEKIAFDIDILNKVTQGGISKGTLNVIMAATGKGKTLIMCHLAAGNMTMGKNVLYITLEVSEEVILKRIDANLFNKDIKILEHLTKEEYKENIDRITSNPNMANLVVKQFPTSMASVKDFRTLLHELKNHKGFIPDIIYVDYVNICTSDRAKGSSDKSYYMVKCISEELRGLAVEYGIPLWTATQPNRGGMNSLVLELTDTSESVGLPFASDFFLSVTQSEDDFANGVYQMQVLKVRDAKKHQGSFEVGVNMDKMRLFDVEGITNRRRQSKESPDDENIMPEYKGSSLF